MYTDVVRKLDINTLNLYTPSCIELNLESIPVSEARSAPSAANVRFADFSYPQQGDFTDE